ncbi:MAG TPA: phosphotransferase [Ktedonobacterales bacterium]
MDAEIDALSLAWAIPGPWRSTELVVGANNRVLRVDTPASGAYVLRIYRNHADPRRVRHELAVVAALQHESLPFVVPAPVATRAGEPTHRFSTPDGEALAVLWPFVPGTHPDRDNLERASAAGEALARLDAALTRVALPASPDLSPPAPMGNLRRRLGLDAAPAEVLATLPGDPESIQRVVALARRVEERVPELYATLPKQIIHGDYDPSNILMEGTRVTAVFDFEFSTRDLRVEELVVPLSWWPIAYFGTGREWPIIDAFGRGYARGQRLQPAEIAALLDVWRLRAVGSLAHRAMRRRRGLTSADQIVRRVDLTLAHEDWLTANGPRLMEMAASWWS